jgi:hypothetical protein
VFLAALFLNTGHFVGIILAFTLSSLGFLEIGFAFTKSTTVFLGTGNSAGI